MKYQSQMIIISFFCEFQIIVKTRYEQKRGLAENEWKLELFRQSTFKIKVYPSKVSK